MFIAEFGDVCGIGDSVDLAIQDLHDNLMNFAIHIEDDEDITVYKGKQVKVTKTWIVEEM